MAASVLRFAAAAASVVPLLWLNGPARADVVTFPTQHVRLGFQANFPFSDTKSGMVPCVSYSASFNGTGSLVVDLGADITVSYDRADIVPGGNVPIHVTYTPTNDAGHEVTVNAAADVDFSTDLDDACIGVVVAGCVLLPLPICPLLIAIAVELDTFHDEFNNFNVISAMGDFKAPLGADPPVVVPGTGDSATLQFLGSDLLKVTPQSSFTFGPTPSAVIPGLGGAVALSSASGAIIASPLLGVLEWQSPSTNDVTITLPATPGPTVTLTLNPVLHWLNTTGSVSLHLDLLGVLGDLFGDPGDISIFSGNLGSFVGADSLICPGFPAVAQAACGTQVAAGNLPYPAFVPQPPGALPGVPPLPAFAPFQFTIDLDSDDDGVPDGTEIAKGTNPDDPDSDHDGYDDGVEIAAGCSATDGTEIPLQPTIYEGSQGGGSQPNSLMTYAAPGSHVVHTGEEPGCAFDGICTAGFCSRGKIADPCSTDNDCNQPPITCRVVVNFDPDVPDLTLLKAEFNKAPLSNVLSPAGCSRKLDLPMNPSVNKNKLRLQAKGTIAGRLRRDTDNFTFRE